MDHEIINNNVEFNFYYKSTVYVALFNLNFNAYNLQPGLGYCKSITDPIGFLVSPKFDSMKVEMCLATAVYALYYAITMLPQLSLCTLKS